jgi:A/G-specific adenine glycosylase
MSSPEIAFPDDLWQRSCRRQMLTWFRREARDLPWRRTRDPYCIWVSEIMLQQTQVATVIDYYQRFLAAFPTVASLAAADEQRVLRQWEGLGYYRRARQLHQAAQRVMVEHQGQLPHDLAALQTLPGIGRYTAGAIASIAWDLRAPILEANTVRVFSRWLALRGDPTGPAGQRLLWQLAECLPPEREAGAFNQSLMELGSQICTPRDPRCNVCPVRRLCPTRALGLQDAIPAATARPAYEAVREAAVVVRRNQCLLLRQRGADERWAGLWDFPRFTIGSRRGLALRRELQDQVRALTGLTVEIGPPRLTIKHGVTRFRITLVCHEAQPLSGRLRGAQLRWVEPGELDHYPLSITARRISRLLKHPP